MKQTLKLCAWSIGLLLFWASSACAQVIVSPQDSQPQDVQTVLDGLARMDVVYLGETHDRQADHDAQLEIIRQLHQQNPQLAIAMEMFQRPYQDAIDQYLAGTITATELRQRSEYDQRWGFSWDYYLPILEFAKQNQLPVIALNTPTEVTRRVAREGLESLTEADRQWVPAATEIRTDPSEYRQMLQDIFESHAGHGNSGNFENFFAAQVLWDETMAAGVAEFLQANSGYQVVVLAGQGHIVYDYGIPNRVERRMANDEDFNQRSILLNPDEAVQSERSLTDSGEAIADYFWITTD
ncbi:ChaN family lipoprotein [Oculatella sp. LEGE 06141]|uniref:ChaN family lipoprotein n=1 Tax=Oculatella sp. LEGE 06141 TaxID=1828648 RepID=UPI001880E4D2|nr:ChaN family lipoprotein [Oculatella sp. LEGE 06141]MBE9178396.1 ChaN family lipoprotein [Oculatella sp. LEGE 06141]